MNNSGIRILIAEDSAIQAEALRRILAKEGYIVSVAKDGVEGLTKVKEFKPELVISDIIMPEMNGFELCRHIKDDPDIGSTPVILLTSLSDPADVISGLECGADNFIVKPYDEHHLLSRIRQIQLNREFQKDERTKMGVEIYFAGKKYFITSEKKQILDLLISTYENAVQKNIELAKVQEELEKLNEQLEQRVQERTAALSAEIAERNKSEELIKNILESVDEGFIIIDHDYRILKANRAFAEQANKPLEDTIGKHCYEISHYCDAPCYEKGENCAVKRVFDTGEFNTVIHTHHDSKGTPVIIETKAYPLFKNKSGKVITAIEILIDITDKKKLEDQLRHAQKMEAVGTLAGGIAHDFNNILNVIMGYGSMIMERLEAGSISKEQMNEVLTAAERAETLTRRLLLFSRKQLIDLKPVNANEIIINLQKMLDRIIGENINFKLDIAEKGLTVMADAGQIEQVLMNLVTNAKDAMPEGGRLTIGTGLQELDDEYVAAYGYGKPGMYALITVADTGHGMDEETKQKLFEPFFTTKEVGKGTGLGLSIAYGIVKQHNGYIKVYSEQGKGTTFKIYLPIIEKIADLHKKIETLVAIKGGTETILVAEDDASLRKLTRTVLEAFGYTVITAEDGEDAITKFTESKDKIQLVILDMIMPKKSGKEACEEIRKLSPRIKTLFESGYTMDIINAQGLIDKGFDFILKPVSPKDLLRKVREILDR